MYYCEGCRGQFVQFERPNVCPLCGVRAGVQCLHCRFWGPAEQFISNQDRCPKCGASVTPLSARWGRAFDQWLASSPGGAVVRLAYGSALLAIAILAFYALFVIGYTDRLDRGDGIGAAELSTVYLAGFAGLFLTTLVLFARSKKYRERLMRVSADPSDGQTEPAR